MSTTNFIPEVWSKAILANYHHQAILTPLASRNYEGEAKVGNTVHIPGIVDITVHDYKAGTNGAPRTTKPDAVDHTSIDLTIDQEKAFDFYVDDVDLAQSNSSILPYTESAGTALTEDAETFLTALLLTGGTAVAGLGTPTKYAEAHNVVKALRAELGKAKVPNTGRVLLVNPEFAGLLLGADSQLVKTNEAGDTGALRDARLGRFLGFDLYENPWMTETKPQAVAFHRENLVYVSQISKVEAMRAQNKFADRVRGLHVYGGKVLRPTAVQVFTAA